MIRIGIILIPVATVLYILSFAISFFANNFWYHLALIVSSMVAGGLGMLLVFIGVLKDRIEAKREEDRNDISQY